MLMFKLFLVSLTLGLAFTQEDTFGEDGELGGDAFGEEALGGGEDAGGEFVSPASEDESEEEEEGAGEAVQIEPTPPYRRQCYIGIGGNLTDIESEIRTCNFLENSCQAKVEISPRGVRVFGECKELRACENNAAEHDCYSLTQTAYENENLEHVCHFCCRGSLCNTALFTERRLQRKQNRRVDASTIE